MKNIFGKILIPATWTIFIEVLLCLPGNELPSDSIFQIPHLDKIVHVIFFGLVVGLWCLYFSHKTPENNKRKWIFFIIFLLATANGILIEYIQYYFIPLRSFDNGDITADVLSAAIVYGICNVKLLSFSGNSST